jgi:crossover junction endodeoxyribonuclease RuvC
VVQTAGSEIALVACGTITTTDAPDFAQRLLLIHRGLLDVLQTHQPSAAAVESVFHSRNARSALKLGHARGAALLTLADAGLEVAEYAPTQVKQALTGSGRADKTQVARMVEMLLGRTGAVRNDATDALAVAICHATMSATQARIAGE